MARATKSKTAKTFSFNYNPSDEPVGLTGGSPPPVFMEKVSWNHFMLGTA